MEVLCYILIIFILIVSLMFFDPDIYNLKCIISSVDGNKYCVRERKNIHKVANLLAKATVK